MSLNLAIQKVNNDLRTLPTNSDSRDLADAIQQLAESEKLIRKTRISWTQSLIQNAGQSELILPQGNKVK